ncbi:response regulator transcription factor [Pseudodonghicola xiamenensis]|uniref:DNA-binding response regulator n=1 Tax=Pseudodonghicola xiamenensis TaxID=337702 RepID=A0A8J3H965_9RHOB|nr:response regulator transcription factor [Pseudodonghicola xiamenensis]GHH03116.1 DNA-binding response regulator [Pseudodonghicola xiamenensis]
MVQGKTDTQISVLVADDHAMVLEMIELFLSSLPELTVQTAQSLDEALELIKREGSFDITLLDLHMPGMNGVEGLTRAIKANNGHPVAILTGNPTQRNVDDILKAGAAGIVLKTTHMRTLANAIRFMAAGEQYVPHELTVDRSPAHLAAETPLSEKETLVLSYLVEGLPNREIAEALGLAEPTIKMHVRSICGKLGVKNRTQAVIKAKDLGIV